MMAAPITGAAEAYRLKVLDEAHCSFPLLWKAISQVCLQAFFVFEKEPTKAKTEAYNELCAALCKAHAFVYRLTTFEATDCPALVRGSNSTRVVGDTAESTQVLVVYYLLKELLKKQLGQMKQSLTRDGINNIIGTYLDTFEKFSAGVNLMKPVFTYLHWVWQKRGLPAEHVIVPTEIISLQFWTEVILTPELKEELKTKMNATVNSIRLNEHTNVIEMENVKRLSLNLAMLHDTRQTAYTSVIEEPYLANMVAFYEGRKQLVKESTPEEYIDFCRAEVKKENERVRYFLCSFSYPTVRQRLTQVLIDNEIEYLSGPTRMWLNSSKSMTSTFKACLLNLYELLGGGVTPCWFEQVLKTIITERVIASAARRLVSEVGMADMKLDAVKETYLSYRTAILETFGNKQLLFSTILDGLKGALFPHPQPSEQSPFSSEVAKLLALRTEEEVVRLPLGSEKGNWIADTFSLLGKFDQDIFYDQYVKLLELRLMKGSLAGRKAVYSPQRLHEKERKMLTDLFERGAYLDFVMRCDQMLKDVYVESDPSKIVSHASGRNVLMSPLFLTNYAWTFVPSPASNALLSGALGTQTQSLLTHIANDFHAKKKGQKSVWLPHCSTAVFRMRTTNSHTVKVIVSCLQLRVIEAFNERLEWSMDALCERTGYSKLTCTELLEPFLKSSLFASTQNGVCARVDFAAGKDEMLDLVCRIHMEEAHASSSMEGMHFKASTKKDKTFAIEGHICKFLKREGAQGIEEIQKHVCNELSVFSVNTIDVKKCIEKLIERAFVERDSDDGALFRFVP